MKQSLRIDLAMSQSSGDYDVEELEELRKERDKLRAFAQAIMDAWPYSDIDGGDLQEIAIDHGILRPEQRDEPCGDDCLCKEYGHDDEGGFYCYRKTSLLTGKEPQSLTAVTRGES